MPDIKKPALMIALYRLDKFGLIEGRTHREIAILLGIKGEQGAVDTRMSRYMRDYRKYKEQSNVICKNACILRYLLKEKEE